MNIAPPMGVESYMILNARSVVVSVFVSLLFYEFALAQEVELRVGDRINLRLSGVPESDISSVSGTYTVSGEGTIRLPYLRGEIPAKGTKPSSLAKTMEKNLRGRWDLHSATNCADG